jgi:hypothetical protein
MSHGFLVLFSPGEDLVCIHPMKPCDMGYRHARLKRLLNDGNLFLWRTAPAALWPD